MEDDRLRWSVKEAALQEYRENDKIELDQLTQNHYNNVETTLRKMRAKQPAHPWYALYVR